eukprot:7718974-Lingulodinium_polyedra.AAC.1
MGPRGPLLARAAWAIVAPTFVGGAWAIPVQGHQTAQRGEFVVAVVVWEAVSQPLFLLTDG